MIRMVVSSFYNTLINYEEAIPTSTMLEIDRIRNNNVLFTVSTNGLYNEILDYNKDFPFVDYIISLNGSYVYDVKNNMVVLNSQFLSNPLELVNTIAHELRHAFQHMRAEKLETREDARYKVNFDNYISPVLLPGGEWLFFTDYYSQYVEVDARVFADKVMEAML